MELSTFGRIQNKLISEEKYSIVHSALMTADVLNLYKEEVKNAVIEWANNQDVTNTMIGDYSVSDIMEEIGCSVFQALCILQAVSVNPDSFEHAVLVLRKDEIR